MLSAESYSQSDSKGGNMELDGTGRAVAENFNLHCLYMPLYASICISYSR